MSKTRPEVNAAFATLLDGAQPKVSKATLLNSIQELLESYTNLRSDTWPAPVKSLLNAPPGSPDPGNRYLTGPAPTGAWDGYASSIAEWDGTQWVITSAANGTLVMCKDNSQLYWVRGLGVWRAVQVPARTEARTYSNGSPVTSSTLQAIYALQVPVVMSRRYRVKVQLLVKSTSAVQGLKVGLAGPGAGTLAWTARIPQAAGPEAVAHGSAFATPGSSTSTPFADVPFLVELSAVLDSPSSADMVMPMIASGDGVAAITVLRGSSITVTDITD